MLMQGFDISFLLTNLHCEEMHKHKLVDFICTFMEVKGLALNVTRLCTSMFKPQNEWYCTHVHVCAMDP